MIVFTPLSGSAQSSSIPTAFCYLLQIDDIRVLLDCGAPDWRLGVGENVDGQELDVNAREAEKLWTEYLDILERNARDIDLVLFTHGSLAHAGLYAYARAKLGLTAPAFATLPVQALGRLAVLEDVEGWRGEVDVDREAPEDMGSSTSKEDENMESTSSKVRKGIATVEEVNEAFESITTLKYSQATHLTGKLQALTLTAFSASHTLGGTLWKLRSASSGTLLYAVGLNHLKEHHLDGTALVRAGGGGVGEGLGRPDLLITDAQRVGVISVRRREREEALLDSITQTLYSSASVLIPVDASTRLLELLIILDQHWTQLKLRAPLCLVARTGKECINFVRSLMEWMGGWMSREGDGAAASGRDGRKKRKRGRGRDEDGDEDDDALLANMVLRFRHLQIFPTPEALMASIPSSTPKVVLATPLTMSHGASRAMFQGFASSPGDLILMVNVAEKSTLGRRLWDRWDRDQAEEAKWGKGQLGMIVRGGGKIRMTINAKVPLQGEELDEYLAAEKAKKEQEAAAAAAAAMTQRLLEADDDDEGDSDDEGSAASSELAVEEELGRGTGEGAIALPFAEGGAGAKAAGPEEDELESARQQLSFDIYLKGNASRAASFFKSATGTQGMRFRMFPYVEKRRRVDSWGEIVDVGAWMRRGKMWEEEEDAEESPEAKEAKRRKVEEEKAEKAPPEPPSKFVTEEVIVDLQCKLFFVDFEGLNDGRATKMIVPQVNPRKMILVAAEPAATAELIESCGEIRSMTREISTPTVGEEVRIGEHSQSYSISLGDQLFSTLKMSKFEDNEVAYVSGRITFNSNSAIPVLEPAAPGKPQKVTSTPKSPAQLQDQNAIAQIPAQILPRTTLIGDLRLTALKARLSSLGIIADFAGEGVLMCGLAQAGKEGSDNDIVSVRKMGRGRVEVEGTVSDVYYTVRKELYGLYAQVAG